MIRTLKFNLIFCILLLTLSSSKLIGCTSFDLDYTFTCATAGDMVTVTWTSGGCAGGELVDISLIDITANAIAQYYPAQANSGSLTITLGAGLTPGPYRMYVQYAPSWPPEAWDYGSDFDIKAVAPVQWGAFDCRKTNNEEVELNWSTHSEVNNSGFELFRSVNNEDWNEIDFVEGTGNSSNLSSYAYTDHFPENGLNYYRLKQVDFDGSFDYSPTISIDFRIQEEPKIFPTQVQSYLNIDLGTEDELTVSLFDLSGKLIEKYSLTGSNGLHKLDVSAIPGQLLMARVEWSGQSYTQKLIKL